MATMQYMTKPFVSHNKSVAYGDILFSIAVILHVLFPLCLTIAIYFKMDMLRIDARTNGYEHLGATKNMLKKFFVRLWFELQVVHFDQQEDALHLIHWSKSYCLAFNIFFLLKRKKVKNKNI